MPYRLKNRQYQIPYGYRYRQPETGWEAKSGESFLSLVRQVMAHRHGNPHLAAQHGWAMDQAGVENDVEIYNVKICEQMGWTQYLSGGNIPPPPKPRPPSQKESAQVAAAGAKAAKIWSGVKTLNSWLDSGELPVPQPQATSRAVVCAACPKNGQGDFTKWFTNPASEAIRRQMAKLAERQLTTPHDAKINVCEVCYCPLKLKVHTPLKYIAANLSDDVQRELRQVPNCWIVAELDA